MHTTEKENEHLEVFLDYCVCVLPVCMYMLHMCVCGVHRGQERVLDALELELQTATDHVDARNTCS